jgi:hypothetical protein
VVASAFAAAARLWRRDPRLRRLAPAVSVRHGTPRLFYRGTQREALHGVHAALSFTDSIDVATIWSAAPGSAFASIKENRQARFLPTSTVHAAYLAMRRPIVWDDNYISLSDVLSTLRFGRDGGITVEEVGKIYNYLHNRLTGKAKGGEFRYVIRDEDGEIEEESDGLDFSGRTRILDEKDLFLETEDLATASRLAADAFIFADTPMVLKAAQRLGHDGIVHGDVFDGASAASKDLLGRKVDSLDGVEEERDIDDEWVPTHRTYRPFHADQVVAVGAVRPQVLLAPARQENPSRRSRQATTRGL